MNLAQLRWPSLALDLAVLAVPDSPIDSLDSVYQTYGITEEQLKEILKIPYFQTLFGRALADLRSQGTHAGSMYRYKALSTSLAEKLFNEAMGGVMETKESIKFLELLYRASGLFDKDKDTTGTQVNTQVNVGVSLPLPTGLKNKKLQHLTVGVEGNAIP